MRRPFLFVLCDLWPVCGPIWWRLYAVKLFADTHTHTQTCMYTHRGRSHNGATAVSAIKVFAHVMSCRRASVDVPDMFSVPLTPPSTTLTRPKSRTFTESVCSIDFFQVKFRTFFVGRYSFDMLLLLVLRVMETVIGQRKSLVNCVLH